ncbi:MAG: ATP-binding protein, partial [Planctomycetes bacterium]|nr:ATP-binding protein [Planctomycetota bacterium]
MAITTDIEGLGVFFLGRKLDAAGSAVTDEPLLYDARDLTTHGLIVGMTGSGKTGLAVGLLEEAALDGVPAIAIDPKGDLGNLLLSFPGLSAQEFAPWVDPAEAQRNGLAPDAYAAKLAETWRKGLADSGQSAERIERLRAAAEFTVYTPGSSAGRQLSILRTLASPGEETLSDPEALRERIGAAVSGLLALLGIEADPLQSPEHILLSRLVERAWGERRDLDLAALIREIQKPPFDRIGVLDLESFYPTKDRAGLALRLNGLVASSNFAAWLEGEPLDAQRLLWTPQGKPRISILSIAHLSEQERMFVVTLVLGELITWMRRQPGTGSLRALLYMDEVYGYFPPVANPPAKGPMLTLLKQARAYGLGVVLATQNPVDLDYKGLSNCGTWFLGRLQTERDKARVLDGLEGASAASGRAFDRARADAVLSGLGKRVFLMNNVHDEAPTLFQTRWTMSYLRGPLTRAQIKQLQPGAAAPAAAQPHAAAAPRAAEAAPAAKP